MRTGLSLLLAATLVGCGTSAQQIEQSQRQYEQRLAQAQALEASGNASAAIAAYRQLADDYPSQGEPWARVAHIDFSQGNYSQAIVAAEETLKRDPSNQQAKSVTAVGGLRLAVRSLEELRTDSALAGDAKSDAQRLAQLLRQTLGEPVLAPVDEPSSRRQPIRRIPEGREAAQAAPEAPARPRPASTAPKPASAATTSSSTPASSGGGAANPFGALQ